MEVRSSFCALVAASRAAFCACCCRFVLALFSNLACDVLLIMCSLAGRLPRPHLRRHVATHPLHYSMHNSSLVLTCHRFFYASQGAYHGRTYGAMSLTTSKTVYRQNFGPLPSSELTEDSLQVTEDSCKCAQGARCHAKEMHGRQPSSLPCLPT